MPDPVNQRDSRATLTDVVTQNVLWERYMKSGQLALQNRDLHEAVRAFTVAVEKTKYFPENDWRRAQSFRWLALVYYDLKNFAQAELLFGQMMALLQRQYGPETPQVAEGMRYLANIFERLGKYEKAQMTVKHLIDYHPRRLMGMHDPEVKSLMDKYQQLRQMQQASRRTEEILWLG